MLTIEQKYGGRKKVLQFLLKIYMPFHNKNDRCYKNNNRNNYDDDEKVQNSQNSKKVVAWHGVRRLRIQMKL